MILVICPHDQNPPSSAADRRIIGAMKRAITLCLLLTACGVGDDGVPSTPEPRECLANLTVTGQFTMSQPAPDIVNNDTGDPPADGKPDIMGCWPTGTWSFSAAVVDNTCKTAPELLPEYKFTATYVPDPTDPKYTYALVTPSPATAMNARIHISSGGGGLCAAGLELFSDDGKKTWNLQPALNTFNASGPLTGQGEYAEWKDSQVPTTPGA